MDDVWSVCFGLFDHTPTMVFVVISGCD